jgi:hypothetical protein
VDLLTQQVLVCNLDRPTFALILDDIAEGIFLRWRSTTSWGENSEQ